MIDRLIDPDDCPNTDDNQQENQETDHTDDFSVFTEEEWDVICFNYECVIFHERDRLIDFGRIRAFHF